MSNPMTAGTILAAAAAGLTTIGTLAPATTGLHTLDLGGAISARYLTTTFTATGGTAIFSADVVARARTITA